MVIFGRNEFSMFFIYIVFKSLYIFVVIKFIVFDKRVRVVVGVVVIIGIIIGVMDVVVI